MINLAFIKNNVKNLLKSSGIVFVSAFLFFIIFLWVFKFDMSYKNGSIEYIEFFMKFEAGEINTFGYNLLRDVVMMLGSTLLFLLILQSSTLYPDLINGSMVKLILSRNIRRSELIWSFYFSELITVFMILMIFGTSITLVILIKSGGYVTIFPIYICTIVFLIFVALFSIITLVSIITKNTLITTILGIISYFVLVPFLLSDMLSTIQFLKYIFPPVLIERELHLKQGGEFFSIAIVSLIYAYLYVKLAIYLFEKMEIN